MSKEQNTTALLYKNFSDRLRTLIFAKVHNAMDAEDILHEVFLKIHNKMETLRDKEKLEQWIFQITRNAIIDYFRATKTATDVDDESFDIEETPEEPRITERLQTSIREMIQELPEPYREALILVEYERMRQIALSKKLGISFSGAKSRVQRARNMLKEKLLQCCHFEFDRYGTIIDYHPISCKCCSGCKP
ncbi:MAG: RNA polymerase sigma factor SigZ [Ignavibacteria bacterium]|nr:RNA polymerase sigma factor SigZ [Ignavibacteria bacterium]